MRSLGHAEQIHPDDEVATRAPLGDVLRCLPDFLRIGINDARAERLLRAHEATMRGIAARLTQTEPGTLSDADIWRTLMWWWATVPDAMQIILVMGGVLLRETAIRKACAAVGFPYEQLVYSQLAAGQRSVSTQQALDLVALAASARHEKTAMDYLMADAGDLTGLCVSPGSVEAEVVVMRDPSEFATMKRGAILVAPATDPSWTPLFTLASGVIVEVGGMLSHASTIAREFGLPALANVKNATRLLKTGDRVRLDATGGRVTR